MSSASRSPEPNNGRESSSSSRHAKSALDLQRMQLERLLKDPSKPAYVPAPPKEKTIRPPREMMKNVQGSSAGAGSGEFHVYKASRRREYERLKLMDDVTAKEAATREFEEKRRKWEEEADAKTAKNRAKRQKKKEAAKARSKGNVGQNESDKSKTREYSQTDGDVPFKKRRLVNGEAVVFRKPGEDEGSDSEDGDGPGPLPPKESEVNFETSSTPIDETLQHEVKDAAKITIIDDD